MRARGFTEHWYAPAFGVVLVALCLAACRVPNLEKPECTEARDAVKHFYSFHFGNDMHPSPESLKARETYLTSDLIANLRTTASGSNMDYFTATDNYPKAFRIGSCSADPNSKVTFQVLLFWRDDNKTEQKEVKVEAIKTDSKWLINKVFN